MRIAVGLVLLAVAAGAAVVCGQAWRLWRVLRRVEVTTPDRLLEAAGAGRLAGTLCAVVGTAGPGRQGELSSAVNHERCVWHRHTVHHRQVRYRTDANGRTRRSTSRKRVGDVGSREAFALTGSSGRVEVHPQDMRVDRPERARTRVLPGMATQPFPEAAALMSLSVQDSYVHHEWVIRAGTPLFVLAEAAPRPSTVALRRPAKGPHLISTRGATRLLNQNRLTAIVTLVVGVAAAIAGAVVLITA